MLPVVGHVRAAGEGRVFLELGVGLVPGRQSGGSTRDNAEPVVTVFENALAKPPNPKDVIAEIHNGTRDVHESKKALSLRRLQMEFSNIQRGLGLKSSASGEWSQDADAALASWLLRPARKQHARAAPLALEDVVAENRREEKDEDISAPAPRRDVIPSTSLHFMMKKQLHMIACKSLLAVPDAPGNVPVRPAPARHRLPQRMLLLPMSISRLGLLSGMMPGFPVRA